MKTRDACLLAGAILVALPSFAKKANLTLTGDDAVYAEDEFIGVVLAIESEEKKSEFTLKTIKNNTETIQQSSPIVSGKAEIDYQFKFDEPGSYIWEVGEGDSKQRIGSIVAPEKIQPASKRPKDFDAFWNSQKKIVRKQPFDISVEPIDLEASEAGYEAANIEISSPGPRPVRGILAKPKDAKDGSLPIVIQFRAAGVKGEWCRANTSEALDLAKRGNGALAFDMNAHGMLNHEDEKYYEDLENGELSHYWEIGIADREDYYFRFMYLRMLRAIEYLSRRPEWDGARILVVGESQGGGQALAAAGLDDRITAAVVTVPAMGDLAAPLVGRKGGWPQPIRPENKDNSAIIKTTSYFDTAHLVKGSKAQIVAEVGLIDETCPATSIYATLNQAKGEVTAYPVSYRAHPWPTDEQRNVWDKTVLAAKDKFIDDYLK